MRVRPGRSAGSRRATIDSRLRGTAAVPVRTLRLRGVSLPRERDGMAVDASRAESEAHSRACETG